MCPETGGSPSPPMRLRTTQRPPPAPITAAAEIRSPPASSTAPPMASRRTRRPARARCPGTCAAPVRAPRRGRRSRPRRRPRAWCCALQSPGSIIDHLEREARERRARIGQGFDDLEVIHAVADVCRRSQLLGKFPRLPCEFGALLFRPSHRYGTADAIGVPDRAVFVLEALVESHVFVACAEPHWQQVEDPGNKQCTFSNTDFCETEGCQMRAGALPAR